MNPLSNKEREALAVFCKPERYNSGGITIWYWSPDRQAVDIENSIYTHPVWLPPNTDDTPEWQRALLMKGVRENKLVRQFMDSLLEITDGTYHRVAVLTIGDADTERGCFDLIAVDILTLSRAILDCTEKGPRNDP